MDITTYKATEPRAPYCCEDQLPILARADTDVVIEPGPCTAARHLNDRHAWVRIIIGVDGEALSAPSAADVVAALHGVLDRLNAAFRPRFKAEREAIRSAVPLRADITGPAVGRAGLARLAAAADLVPTDGLLRYPFLHATVRGPYVKSCHSPVTYGKQNGITRPSAMYDRVGVGIGC